MTPDPIGLAGGLNTFAYVGGQPTRMVDPLGLKGQGPGGSGSGSNQDSEACTCSPGDSSFLDEFVSNYTGTMDTIDHAFDDVPFVGDWNKWNAASFADITPSNAAGWATGGWMASQYGGQTAAAGASRWAARGMATSFSMFRRYGRPDIGRWGATTALNTLMLKGSFSSGVLVGSLLRAMWDRNQCR